MKTDPTFGENTPASPAPLPERGFLRFFRKDHGSSFPPYPPVILPSRVARGKFCCGLEVRAGRAGSIGRDGQRLEG
jgi:hypothetical protein